MFSLQPLGDQAVLAYCADEAAALEFAAAVRQSEPAWLVDVVQAYTSVAVFFECGTTPGSRRQLKSKSRRTIYSPPRDSGGEAPNAWARTIPPVSKSGWAVRTGSPIN